MHPEQNHSSEGVPKHPPGSSVSNASIHNSVGSNAPATDPTINVPLPPQPQAEAVIPAGSPVVVHTTGPVNIYLNQGGPALVQTTSVPATQPHSAESQALFATSSPVPVVSQNPDPFPPVAPQQILFAFGSAECDQFPNDDDIYERKRPFPVLFPSLAQPIKIMKIACGAQHALVLTRDAKVFSFGNSDDGCLGRDESTPFTSPGLVPLPIPVDLISAGEAHSVAANSVTGTYFVWGAVKSAKTGKLFKIDAPEEKNYYYFSRGIQDLKSGENHIIILAQNKVYSFGDNDTGALGTVFRGELENTKVFEPNAIGLKNVVRIWVGKHATFLENKQHQIFGCGLNNYGQMGQKPETEMERWLTPEKIEGLDGNEVADIVGGDHHTLVLKKDGSVWGSGRNDDGQLGELEEPQAVQDGQQNDQADEEVEFCDINGNCYTKSGAKVEKKEEGAPGSPEHPAHNHPSLEDSPVKSPPKDQESEEQQETDRVFGFRQLKGLSNIGKVWSSNHFNYAQEKNEGPLYAWGLGFSYVLANGKEDALFQPRLVNDEKFWAGKRPTLMALGTAHVIFGTEQVEDTDYLRELVFSAKKRTAKVQTRLQSRGPRSRKNS